MTENQIPDRSMSRSTQLYERLTYTGRWEALHGRFAGPICATIDRAQRLWPAELLTTQLGQFCLPLQSAVSVSALSVSARVGLAPAMIQVFALAAVLLFLLALPLLALVVVLHAVLKH